MVVVGLTIGIEGVPEWESNTEKTLTADQPVAVEAVDPVLVAGAHELRVEVDLLTTRDQRFTQVKVPPAIADIPLARGHDLERLVAPLVVVGLALGRGRLAVQIARDAQGVDDRGAGRESRLAGELGEQCPSRLGRDPRRGLSLDPATALDDRAGRQLQLAPPLHVREIAERAAHGDARAFVRLGEVVGDHRDLDPEQR